MSQEKNTAIKRRREHLNPQERKIIERMQWEGANKGEIARALFRHKSTIKREIKRGSVTQRRQNPYESRNPQVPEYIEESIYFWDIGQRIYEQHRQSCGSKNKVIACRELVSFVEEKVLGKEKWSPDATIGHAKANKLFPGKEFATKTFHNWVDDGLVKVKNIDLLLKVRRKPSNKCRAHKKVLGKSIEQRPAAAKTREAFGHWEGDGIVGKGQQGHLITLVERKLGVGLQFNAGSKESGRIAEILDDLQRQYGQHFPAIFKTITFDNGTEFSDMRPLQQQGRECALHE